MIIRPANDGKSECRISLSLLFFWGESLHDPRSDRHFPHVHSMEIRMDFHGKFQVGDLSSFILITSTPPKHEVFQKTHTISAGGEPPRPNESSRFEFSSEMDDELNLCLDTLR